MTKTSIKLIAATALAGVLTIPSLAHAQRAYRPGLCTPVINRREHRQQLRVRQGVLSAELTRQETRRLLRQEAHIRRHEARVRADGIVTHQERLRVNRQLISSSRNIYRLKHNNRVRGL